MNFNNCFHEICHLWVMIYRLGFNYGRAYLVYDIKDEGMLSIEGYKLNYNNYDDLVKSAEFIVAGVVGDKINGVLTSKDDIFNSFSTHYSYEQDYKWFKKLHKTAVSNHSLKESEVDWFSKHFLLIENYLNNQSIDVLKHAATKLLDNGEYVLTNQLAS